MVAVGILGIVLGAAAASISQGTSFSRRARQSGEAERIASAHLEQLLLRHDQSPLPDSGEERFDEQGRISAAGRYRSRWFIVPNKPIRGAGRLEITVNHDLDNTAVHFVTYLGKR